MIKTVNMSAKWMTGMHLRISDLKSAGPLTSKSDCSLILIRVQSIPRNPSTWAVSFSDSPGCLPPNQHKCNKSDMSNSIPRACGNHPLFEHAITLCTRLWGVGCSATAATLHPLWVIPLAVVLPMAMSWEEFDQKDAVITVRPSCEEFIILSRKLIVL